MGSPMRGRSPPASGKDKAGGSSKTLSRSPSPARRFPRRRSSRGNPSRSVPRDARRLREVVVERIIREGDGSGTWP